MKKIIYFIMLLAAVSAALTLAACGKKDSSTTGSSTDIVAEIPYVGDFTCDYYAGEGFANRVARSTAFGSEDDVLIKLSFTLSPKAFKNGKRRLTIKPILSEGFDGSIVSANTSSVNNTDLTAAYDVDDRKSKDCVIEFKTKFNHSNGKLQIGYSYDGDEYQVTGSYALSCGQSFVFTYDAVTDGYIVSKHDYGFSGGSRFLDNKWLDDVECVEIPDTFAGKPVTAIADYLFSACSNLTDVKIPDSVISIGDSAFEGCSSLTSITIPNSVTSIGDYAFCDCNLTSITIPDGVTSIGDGAFSGCNNLQYNEYENAYYLGNEKNPYIIFIKPIYNDIIGVEINGATEFIHSYACYRHFYLTSITIPDSVTSIGSGAFKDCSSLTSITIPDSVTSIGSGAFKDCSSLTSITIPDSVTSIGRWAFDGCDNLQFNEYGNAKYLGNEQNPYLLLTGLINKDITSFEINGATKVIYGYTFWCYSSLTSITIPDSVTSIGEGAFKGCSSLTSITIPDSVTSIGGGAFRDCSSLTSITIPDSVTSIGGSAFDGCRSLTSIIFYGTKEEWLSAISPATGNESDKGLAVVYCSDENFRFHVDWVPLIDEV